MRKINVFRSENMCVTKVWLSIKVTSAQKLEMVIAMVFPLNPSEGFPINPTLWVNTQLWPLYSSDWMWIRKKNKAFFITIKMIWVWCVITWRKIGTWLVLRDCLVSWRSSVWATWCSLGGPEMSKSNIWLAKKGDKYVPIQQKQIKQHCMLS